MEQNFWQKLAKSAFPIIGLAPMDGVSDAAFRYMVAKHGSPDVIFTEFVNVEGLARGNIKGLTAFIYNKIERPVVAQIFGIEPASFYKATLIVCALGFDGIDINMGCPVPKIAKKGSGAALIKTPSLAKKLILTTKKAAKDWSQGITLKEAKIPEEIIKEIKKMNTIRNEQTLKFGGRLKKNPRGKIKNSTFRVLLPVSVKTRIGYDKDISLEWTKHLLEAHPAAITMHGRTLKQLYKGRAKWDSIAVAAQLAKQTQNTSTAQSTSAAQSTSTARTLLLGNGDITSYEDAIQKCKTYKTDGVLVGRAVLGNPWFFKSAEAVPSGKILDRHKINSSNNPTHKTFIWGSNLLENKKLLLHAAIQHIKIHQSLNHLPFHTIKKHLAAYIKGFSGATKLRQQVMLCENESDTIKTIKNWENPHKNSHLKLLT